MGRHSNATHVELTTGSKLALRGSWSKRPPVGADGEFPDLELRRDQGRKPEFAGCHLEMQLGWAFAYTTLPVL